MLRTERPILGLDIGGTNIKSGILLGDHLMDIRSTPTPSNETQEFILETISDIIQSYIQHDFIAIGIGIPGLINSDKGIVLNLANIPSFKKVYLRDFLQARYNRPIFINNDANCFVLGEYKFGKAKTFKNVVGITLGTGVGAGIIANGNLYQGFNCAAGEWCSISYLNHDFEYYCSSKYFLSEHGIKPKGMAKKALEGDQNAIQAFKNYGGHLGEFIKHILYTLAPEAIILGGSIRKAFPLFRESMMESISTFRYPSVSQNLKILISDLDETGIHGAVALIDEFAIPMNTRPEKQTK